VGVLALKKLKQNFVFSMAKQENIFFFELDKEKKSLSF
jgi:hypothetical protein